MSDLWRRELGIAAADLPSLVSGGERPEPDVAKARRFFGVDDPTSDARPVVQARRFRQEMERALVEAADRGEAWPNLHGDSVMAFADRAVEDAARRAEQPAPKREVSASHRRAGERLLREALPDLNTMIDEEVGR